MIRFEYQPTFADYAVLNRRHAALKMGALKYFGGLCALAFLLQPWVQKNAVQPRGVFETYGSSLPLLILPGILLFVILSTRYAVRKRWDTAEEVRLPKLYEIDDHGVKVTNPSLVGYLEWRHFTYAELARGYFFLKTAQNQYHYFPESAVPDKEQLLALLRNKIPASITPSGTGRKKILVIWLCIVFGVLALLFFYPSGK
jgi:hypothetical protein